tara:strand:- start:231 stop:446 length:216 start_codon:yes stop_codon:yes gene_type:complete
MEGTFNWEFAIMKTLSLELVLFGWLAYNIAIEIASWFEKDEIEVPPAIEVTPANDVQKGTDFPVVEARPVG